MENKVSDYKFVFAIERDVEALLEDLSFSLTKEEIAYVREDLNYGEWDIAVEQIAGVIVNMGKPLTENIFTTLVDLECRLKLQNSKLMQALHIRAVELGVEPADKLFKQQSK